MPQDTPARLVPVWRDLLCDGVTPVEVYARLRTSDRRGSPLAGITFMLESVGAGERWARYSVVGVGCRARVTGIWDGDDVALTIQAAPGFTLPADIPAESCGLHLHARGLAALRALLAAYRCPPVPDLPRFWGGLCGVWGHDMVRVFEPSPPQPGVTLPSADLPALDLIVTDTLVVFDNFSQRVRIVACACPETDGGPIAAIDAAYARIDAVAAALDTAAVLRPRHLPQLPPPQARSPIAWSRDGYLAAVTKAKQYIAAGDIFQVVLSQAFRVPRAHGGALDAIELYRMLRVTNPAPYMYIFELPSAGLIGASPEVLVRLDHAPGPAEAGGLRVTLRPIAGTRPRGPSEAEDAALAEELLADPKERAEHLMLVDLGRNDLGRVCAPGSVEVSESFVIERYSRVMHIVSEIQGDLRPELDALDALKATFPAGTLSGAPKIRALQIIDELEPVARGWYGGAVGYLGFDGAADFAICIRSLVRHRDHIRVQAGAGIVHDSVPAAEERECQAKASAVVHAVELAAEASDPVPAAPEAGPPHGPAGLVGECPR
ncbi:MAG: anthranilate synthase component I family protein [Myxococcales bacterium]|nr:anthranilate synthase component I family protein [Myxococcales bacterium]